MDARMERMEEHMEGANRLGDDLVEVLRQLVHAVNRAGAAFGAGEESEEMESGEEAEVAEEVTLSIF